MNGAGLPDGADASAGRPVGSAAALVLGTALAGALLVALGVALRHHELVTDLGWYASAPLAHDPSVVRLAPGWQGEVVVATGLAMLAVAGGAAVTLAIPTRGPSRPTVVLVAAIPALLVALAGSAMRLTTPTLLVSADRSDSPAMSSSLGIHVATWQTGVADVLILVGVLGIGVVLGVLGVVLGRDRPAGRWRNVVPT